MTAPLLMFARGGWTVPGAVPAALALPEVRASLARVVYMPPKPAVTAEVMNRAQFSMIAPDVPWVHDV